MAFGTNDLRDTSRILQFGTGITTIAEFGEANAYAEIERVLQIHNQIVAEMTTELCQVTENFMAVYGGQARMKMVRGNEHAAPDNQKAKTGTTIGFPLAMSQIGMQWTRHAFMSMSTEQMRLQFESALGADVQDFHLSIMNAIFNSVNTENYEDDLVEYFQYPVVALLNGDGRPIPSALDGSSFPSNHTHYTYATSLTEQVVRDTITNVAEHGLSGQLRLYINRAQEATIWSMQTTGAFHPFLAPNINPGALASYAVGQTLDVYNVTNRAIGYFDGAEVWVKSWVPPSYIMAVDVGGVDRKPLAYRVRPNGLYSELGLRYEHEHFPLRAQVMTREYGIAAWNRHMIAVCYIDAAASAYVVPTTFPNTL